MNKKDLIVKISKKTGFSRKETTKMMAAFIDEVGENLSQNKKIKLTGFGTFFIKKRKPRQIVHPRDASKLIQIEETYKPTFKPTGKFLKKIKS